MTDDCSLYRHFDGAGKLLYVGISLSPLYRLSQHRRGASWFLEIARVEIQQFESRDRAEAAERAAIVNERPKYNTAHVPAEHHLHRLAEAVRRATTNRDIIELCDGVLALAGPQECAACSSRRRAKATAQRRWRAKHRAS